MDTPSPPSPPPDWVELLSASELLQGLEEPVLRLLAAELTPVQLAPGDLLVEQGAAGDGMYVVVDGCLRAVVEPRGPDERVLREMRHGESIGEISLITGQTRTATVYAVDAAAVARLSKDSFEGIAAREPHMGEALQEALTAHIRRRQLRSVLRAARCFRDLNERVLRDLEDELTWVTLPGGEELIREGEPGDCMYVIVSGRLRVVLGEGPGERVLREMARGETIGEIALLTGEPRTATIYAVRDSEVARLSRASFDRLLERHPHDLTRTFTRTIIDIVVSRDRRRGRPDDAPSLSVAVVPAGSGPPIGEATRRLVRAFETLGETLHVSSEVVDRALGKAGIAQEGPASEAATAIQLIGWLSEQEGAYRYLVYEADPSMTPWTRRCARQADHLVLVGHAGSDAGPNALEAALAGAHGGRTRTRTTLVLLHPDGGRLPAGTRRWLAGREIDQHHHVRLDRHGDFERVARTVAGRAVGLALGGGGARGAAHIGVLQALVEARVPVDVIGGTSIGANMAGFWAMGWDVPEIMARLRQAFTKGTSDATLPVVALTSGRDATRLSKRLYGDVQIEDLWVPCFCVSTNLTRAEVVVHRSGSLWEAVRASGAAPGIFPPVVAGGDLLVDGALLNNLPMDVMREHCGHGTVIAVDVTPPVDLDEIAPYGDQITGLQALAAHMNPFTARTSVPNILSLLYRAGQVGSVRALKDQIGTGVADLYLRPPVDDFGLLDWKAMGQVVEQGHRYAAEQLRLWQEAAAEHGAVAAAPALAGDAAD